MKENLWSTKLSGILFERTGFIECSSNIHDKCESRCCFICNYYDECVKVKPEKCIYLDPSMNCRGRLEAIKLVYSPYFWRNFLVRYERRCPECGELLRLSPSAKRWHCDNPECYVDHITYAKNPKDDELKISRIVKVAAL